MTDESETTGEATKEARAKEARAKEAAVIRRRWITLGEGIAVLAVTISAMTLYINWSDKQDRRAEKTAESQAASVRAARLVLHADSSRATAFACARPTPAKSCRARPSCFPRRWS